MKRKMLIALSLVLFAAMAFTATASAEGFKGKGRLEAWGDGIAGIYGRGRVNVTGRGILWIKDIGGDAEWSISGTGEKRVFENDWIEYLGFHGEFEMTGSHIMVVLSGNNIHLTAAGRGKAILWGEGHYQVGPRTGEWSTQMQVLSLGEAN
jgi:hypothetical protein